jgi:hypothetical protein
VTSHISSAIESVSPQRFRQEANYVAALARAIEGSAYHGPSGAVVFSSTVVDDRGRNSAEHQYGADLVITADITGPAGRIRKAIMVQAKLGMIADLDNTERSFLNGQIEKMQAVTRSPKVMEIVETDGVRMPRMVSGCRVVNGESYRPMDLPAYFTARVLTTLDGDTDEDFVAAVQDSGLTRINTTATLA